MCRTRQRWLVVLPLTVLALAGCGGKSGPKTVAQAPKPQVITVTGRTATGSTKTSPRTRGATTTASRSSSTTQTTAASSSSQTTPASAPTASNFDGLATFGASATGGTRAAIVATVMTYETAIEHSDWARACAELYPKLQTRMEAMVRAQGSQPSSCPRALSALTGQEPAAERKQDVPTKIAAVRFNGSEGFLLYSSPDTPRGSMPVGRVGSSWKVGALAGSSLSS